MTHLLVLYILHRWRAELVVNIDCVVSQLKEGWSLALRAWWWSSQFMVDSTVNVKSGPGLALLEIRLIFKVRK